VSSLSSSPFFPTTGQAETERKTDGGEIDIDIDTDIDRYRYRYRCCGEG